MTLNEAMQGPAASGPDRPRTAAPHEPALKRLTGGGLLARNAAWNLATQCLPMAVALATLPRVVRGLGTDRFGVMTLSWVVLGYFSLFDLGLGRALTQMVADRLGRDRAQEVPGLVWTAMALMTALGLLGTALVALGAPWLVASCLRIGGPLGAEAVGAFWLMGAALPFVIGTCGLRGVMEAHQRLGAVNAVRAATSLFLLLAPLAVIPFTRDLRWVVGAVALGRVGSWGAHVAVCLRGVPGLARGAAIERGLVRPLLGFGGWMTAVSVINPLMVQMDRFLIGAVVSASAVAFYTTPFELITKAWFLSNAVLGVMFPAFAASFAGDRGRTAAIFGRCVRYVGLILFPAVLGGVALGPEVLGLWLGADFAARSTGVLRWLAVGVLFNGLAQVPSALIQGVGRPDLTFKVHLVELPPYLLAACWLTLAFGIEGAAVAWAARTALDFALMFAAAGRVLPEGSGVVRALAPALAAAVGALGLVALPLGTAYRASALAVADAAFAAAAWSWVLGPEDRAGVVGRLAQARERFAWRGGGVGPGVGVAGAPEP